MEIATFSYPHSLESFEDPTDLELQLSSCLKGTLVKFGVSSVSNNKADN